MHSTADSHTINHRLVGLGVLLILVGVAGYFGIKLGEARVNATAHWPAVTGHVEISELSTATVKTGPVRRTTPIAKIRYAYSVNGQRLECDGLRVVPMLHTNPEGTPEEIVARYPVGKSVKVFYDPNNPKDALLTPVPAENARSLMRSLAFVAPCVGFVGLLLAIVGGVNLLSKSRETLAASSNIIARNVETPLEIAWSFRSVAPAFQPAQPMPPAPQTAPLPARPVHWLVRGAATSLGLFLLLFGSLLLTTLARRPLPSATTAVHVTMLVIFGGVAMFGGYLVCVGVRRPTISSIVT